MLELAYATLSRGACFLRAGHATGSGAQNRTVGRYREKVLGNGLRELDRFLNLLIDAVAQSCGIPLNSNERNTANKLRRLRRAMATDDHDHARLTALGRSRDCLFHCSGRVRRGNRDGDGFLIAGWPRQEPLRVPIGQRLTLSEEELTEICDYYLSIADALRALAPILTHRP